MRADTYAWKIMVQFHNSVPDCWYSGDKNDLWVEVKYIKKLPIRKQHIDLAKMLSEGQKYWLQTQYDTGRNTAVILGSPAGGAMFFGSSWAELVDKDMLTATPKELADTIMHFCGRYHK